MVLKLAGGEVSPQCLSTWYLSKIEVSKENKNKTD